MVRPQSRSPPTAPYSEAGRSSHLAVSSPHPAPRMRAHDSVGDMDVPNLRGVLRLIGIEQRLELGDVDDVCAAQAEALGDRRQVGAAEDRAAVVDPVGAQLWISAP